MKRLVIDVNPIVPYYVTGKVTGIGRTTLELIQALAKVPELPFEVVLYSQNMKGIGGRNAGLPFKNKHLYLPHREKIDRLLARFPVREWFTGYDLMHIPHNFEYVYRPDKCVVTLHDALFMKIQESAFNHEQMRQIVPPFMHRCKHIITCSEASKRDIVETMGVNPEKITVIYWGVKHDIFFPQKDKLSVRDKLQSKFKLSNPYFLSVSCNAERKRTDVLVRSYIALSNKQTLSHDLVLVWGNPPISLLEEVKNSCVANRIHFLKNISDEDLALLYNGANAMFFPSSYEGFGLPILEAMACGTPVVTCRNSSLDEIAGDAAIYLEEPISNSLFYVMRQFELHELELDSMIERGLKRAALFNWGKTAEETVQVYSKMLNLI
ncbi:glycosyltransferase family 1 protein [Barnesiella viscericola]|uniref:glycosyltransferase family 4 protein n=1 Tax=Barnesiella viscericola TaxID=397865 RepID=UPI0025A41640|nr:glycosyltransferase family 1 protein [Barnesiella viscericola]MDM8269663.1 glycosyltransferase family 1 protein [Barnesiella viscericola]